MIKKVPLQLLFLFGVVSCLTAGGACFGQTADTAALLKQAEQLKRDDQYEQAEAIYQQIIEASAGTEDALAGQRELTCFYISTNRQAKAATAYQKMLEDFEGFEGLPTAVMEVADEFRDNKRYSEALGVYQEVLKQWPSSEVGLQAQRGVVQANILLGDESNAQAAFDEMVSEYGRHSGIAEAIYSIGRCFGKTGKYERAVEFFEYVEQNWPASQMVVWSKMGSVVAGAGLDSNSAVEAAMGKLQARGISVADARVVVLHLGDFCRYLVEIDDRREPVTINKLLGDFQQQDARAAVDHMGDLYRDTRKYDKAAELFECVADTWAQSSRAIESQSNIVKMYISIGDEPNATAHFDNLISKFGEDEGIAAAVENVAQEYLEFGSTQKAYEKFKYIIEHWPGSGRAVWAKTGMVMSRIRAMDFEEAEAELWELLDKYSMDKELPAGMHEIVEEYRNVGAYDTGRELFGWLLENWQQGDKTMLELQVGVALQSIRLRELDKAAAAVDKLIADYNDNPNLAKGLFQIAEEYYMEGFRHENQGLVAESKYYFAQAVNVWEKIIADMPESEYAAEGSLHCGDACCILGEYDQALWLYQHLVDNWPQHKYAPHAQFLVAHTCQDLINRGIMPEAEAMPLIRQAYDRILADYADSEMAERAKRWFKIYNGSSTGEEK